MLRSEIMEAGCKTFSLRQALHLNTCPERPLGGNKKGNLDEGAPTGAHAQACYDKDV